MVDMSQFIAARSDQLNADDLLDAPRTITITKVTASPDSAEQPVAIHYEGGESRPFKPCKTMRRIMVAVWGKDASKYAGRSMTLYRDPDIQFGGMKVGGIRISHMSHISEPKTVALLVTRGRKAPYTVQLLQDVPTSQGDFSAELEQLKALARPGNMDALGAKWQDIGPAARKALASHLPALKAACAEPDDVSFNSGPSDEPNPETNDIAPTLKKIADAVSEREVDAIDKDTENDRAFLTDEQCTRLDEAFATKRAELRERDAEKAKEEAK